MYRSFFIGLLLLVVACQAPVSQEEKDANVHSETVTSSVQTVEDKIEVDQSDHHQYTWKTSYELSSNLVNTIATPKGYTRTKVDENSFQDWLRHLPLMEKGSKVFYFNGSQKNNQTIHAAVIDLDTGKKDLQQCADAVMRLKAEYHYSKKEFDQIHFNYTSGDKVSFNDWQKGRKPIVKGNKVHFSNPSGTIDISYPNFKKYMQSIFNYAGTSSLSKEMQKVDIEDMQIGDVFIQGGFPGHAVIVVDMAINKNGKKLFMIAQSYMPAQDMHILHNFNNQEITPWYALDFDTELSTPEWNFTRQDLKRFK